MGASAIGLSWNGQAGARSDCPENHSHMESPPSHLEAEQIQAATTREREPCCATLQQIARAASRRIIQGIRSPQLQLRKGL